MTLAPAGAVNARITKEQTEVRNADAAATVSITTPVHIRMRT